MCTYFLRLLWLVIIDLLPCSFEHSKYTIAQFPVWKGLHSFGNPERTIHSLVSFSVWVLLTYLGLWFLIRTHTISDLFFPFPLPPLFLSIPLPIWNLMYSSITLNLLCIQIWPWTRILLPSSQGYRQKPPSLVCDVLWIRPGALFMLGRHSTNSSTSPGPDFCFCHCMACSGPDILI